MVKGALRAQVRPELLRWAAARSGRSREDLLRQFPKLQAWESGDGLPTFKQLESFARTTHAPIGYLFLDTPPIEGLPVRDFRAVGDGTINSPSPELLDTIYLCIQRQDWYREEALTAGAPPLEFLGSMDISDDPTHAATSIRALLGLVLEERQKAGSWEEALRKLIESADKAGILVMVSGIVGSNSHRKLNVSEFRGFALVDTLAPLVFVNGRDAKAAQMFTFAHELAHLWLGESGVSNAHMLTTTNVETEKWCNKVAAEFLVPADVVRDAFNPKADLVQEAQRLAILFKVSTLVVLGQIFESGGISWGEFRSAYSVEYARASARTRTSGGDQIRNVGARVSTRLSRAVVVSALEGRTSFTEAFRLLGISQHSSFEKLAVNLGVTV